MTTVKVSTLNELHAALANAKGGETILLAEGNYGELFMAAKSKFPITFPSTVTIASADPAKPAVLTGLDLRGAGNLTFDGILFDYTFKEGDNIWKRPFSVVDSDHITIRNSVFDGDLARGVSEVDDGLGWAFGLAFRQSSNILVENNEVYNFYRGMVFSGSDITVRDNELHSLRMDGMNFSKVSGVLIENNHLHNFVRSADKADHADMIQFWTNGATEPSTDITIRGNILDVGEGNSTQSIFMRNEEVDRGRAGEEMFYRNILIEDNVIINGHLHGITVGETDGLVIRNNTVVSHVSGLDGTTLASVSIPRINLKADSVNVEVTGNITSAIGGWSGQDGWTVKNNAFVQNQDPFGPGFYGDVFVTSSMQVRDGAHGFLALPGGMIDLLGAGATATHAMGGDGLQPLFHSTAPAGNGATRIFDAGLSGVDLKSLPKGTLFEWDFGDGTTGTGSMVSHSYERGGYYDVVLTLRLPDGRVASEGTTVAIAGPEVLRMAADGSFLAHGYGTQTMVLPDSDGVAGLKLGATNAGRIAQSDLREMFLADSFEISMTLAADKAGNQGEVFRMNGSFIATVDKSGAMSFRLWSTEASDVRLVSTGVAINDGAAHDIVLRAAEGRAQLLIDGALVAEVALPGALRGNGSSNFGFGNGSSSNFEGVLSAFEIIANSEDYGSVWSGMSAPEPMPEPVPVPEPEPEPAPEPEVEAKPEPAPEPAPAPEPEPVPAPETEASAPSGGGRQNPDSGSGGGGGSKGQEIGVALFAASGRDYKLSELIGGGMRAEHSVGGDAFFASSSGERFDFFAQQIAQPENLMG